MKIKHLFLTLLTIATVSCHPGGKLSVNSLTCEYMSEPNSIDVAAPRLSWIDSPTSPSVKGECQSAYRILVASSKELLAKDNGDLWDSGKVLSSDSYLVTYGGKELADGQSCHWKVKVWDSSDCESAWSEPALWTMGMMDPSGWKAAWIGAPWQEEGYDRQEQPAPMFRKCFEVGKAVADAKAFVVGLGFFEFYLNGKKVGDECLVPNFTDFSERPDLARKGMAIPTDFRDRRVMYLVYDVKDALRKGANAAGMLVGNGWYNTIGSSWVEPFGSPRMLCQIEIKYTDGSAETIVSDTSWKVKRSPIVMNNVYKGETYDARLETPGWAEAGLDESDWEQAVPRQAPTGHLEASCAPLDRVTKTLEPISLKEQWDGTWLVDFGEEIAGWIRFKDIRGEEGKELKVKFICESQVGDEVYVFKGSGKESYAPRFSWFVFSKAIIEGVDELKPSNLVAEAVNTDVPVTSSFKSSNPLFEKINAIWQRSQSDNMHCGIASDCPHRERSPYTGDGQVAAAAVMTNYDAAAFYQKWVRDMNFTQNVNDGYVPNSAPWQPRCGGGVPWGAAMNVIPWDFYCHYGDIKMLQDNYFAMTEQVRYMSSWETPEGTMFSQRGTGGRVNYWLNLGDWCPPYENPSDELVHTFYWWYCTEVTARAAKALGIEEDYERYSAEADAIAKAFHKKFYSAEGHTYGDSGSNVFALVMGVPQDLEAGVVEALRSDLTDKYSKHLDTGIFGTRFLFEVLARYGLNDLAYEIMCQMDYPGYGYWLSQGSTVTWEHWNGQSSHNHPMFGGGLTWFYDCLGGINFDEAEPGFKHVVIRPYTAEGLESFNCTKMTPYGEVRTSVSKDCLEVSVPVGAHATVYWGDKVEEIGQGTYKFEK